MPDPQDIINAAQAICPALPQLLPAETAAKYNRQIKTLLAQISANPTQASQPQVTQLSSLLRQSESTRDWIQRYLNGEPPAEITRSMRLPGDGRPISYPRFKCPDCNYTWSQIEVSDPVPPCGNNPNHASLQRL